MELRFSWFAIIRVLDYSGGTVEDELDWGYLEVERQETIGLRT